MTAIGAPCGKGSSSLPGTAFSCGFCEFGLNDRGTPVHGRSWRLAQNSRRTPLFGSARWNNR